MPSYNMKGVDEIFAVRIQIFEWTSASFSNIYLSKTTIEIEQTYHK